MAAPHTQEKSYLAFDLGASSSRAILGRLNDGRMEMEEIHRFQTPIVEDGAHLYWDFERIWGEMEHAARLAKDESPVLRSVSVDSWGVDYVPLDSSGNALRRPYAYRDPRVLGMLAKAESLVPRERIYEETGIQFMEINTLFQILADVELEPDLVQQTSCRLMIADYFNYLLSGRVVNEVSLASTTQLLNARTRTWSEPLLRAFGLPQDAWSVLVDSGTRLGAAASIPDVEVIAGCSHDTACAVAAAPVEADGGEWAYLSCGTWSLLGVELSEPLLNRNAMTAGFTNEAGLNGSIRFLKNMTGLWVLQECERGWKDRGENYSYDQLMQEAERADPPSQLVDLDDPRFGERGDMLEKLRSYCEENGMRSPASRGDVVRLIIESLAAAHERTLRLLEGTTGKKIDTLHLVGGGSQIELLCRLTAQRCRCRVVAGPVEATALGNLLIQARTMGDLPGDVTIREAVRRSVELREYGDFAGVGLRSTRPSGDRVAGINVVH